MSDKVQILWADDEIDLLKPHVLFLEEKGYDVDTVTNGTDAVEKANEKNYDIIFLDENMPGLSGLETLSELKAKDPGTPIIMITKSEEEAIMEEAIGSKISDYLIKPVNPRQILLSLKKNLDTKRLVSEKTTSNYQQRFREISMELSGRLDHAEWSEMYKQLVYWDLELSKSNDPGMTEIQNMQRSEANGQFSRFVSENYTDWLSGVEDAPLMSHRLFKEKISPEIEGDGPLFVLLIDNLRYDQWIILKPLIQEDLRIESEEMYYSILPTATQYSRNSIFSGLLPSEMAKNHPDLWLNDEDEGGKNMYEAQFLESQLQRLGKNVRHSYNKITNLNAGKKLVDIFSNLFNNQLNVIVYNFVDMLSHARTEMEMIRELADDSAAYRSLTLSWFEHSALRDMIRQIAEKGGRVVLTTDHGTIQVKEPVKVIGDRNTNSNLRYKQGKNLNYNAKEVFEIHDPSKAYLPKQHVSTRFIFAKEDQFFVYPNNYNHYVNYFRDTFQHGGISMEEMLIPVVTLRAK